MDSFNFCWGIILSEAKKHKVASLTKRDNFGGSYDFSTPINRLEHLYKHGIVIISLVRESVIESSKNPEIFKAYNELTLKDNCKICCLSNGPGIELSSLLFSLLKIQPFQRVSVNLFTKYEEWLDISKQLIFNPFQLNQWDMSTLGNEVRQSVQKADLVLMVKTYEHIPDPSVFTAVLNEILTAMKKGAILFFIDSKAKMKILKKYNFCGKFLHGPVKIKVDNIPFDKTISQSIGVAPINVGSRSTQFALWKKSISSLPSKMLTDNKLPNLLHTLPKDSLSMSALVNDSSLKSYTGNASLDFEKPLDEIKSASYEVTKNYKQEDSATTLGSDLNTVQTCCHEVKLNAMIDRCEELMSNLEKMVETFCMKTSVANKFLENRCYISCVHNSCSILCRNHAKFSECCHR